ncbi:histone acetyltransferase type B catalytic subunit [Linderina pennispora]|uniref:Histone acetyltransferase type B catalytic subunit n=1 Tax=Linderina pennispora TaxID=61395 RepID=A0A1Y1WGU5_9FUNG|nr:histone acetyltransferase type B catalytic subunit [Linderina pennispora]ORX72605.1 histone acetyltransferase type B catalytic subunit [Linderina pennispora]
MDEILAANASQWVADSNSAVFLRLISGETTESVLNALRADIAEDEEGADGADAIEFHPIFTYPIYGEQERIFGYKGLRISLYYAAGSLATYFSVDYTKRIDGLETSLPVQLKSDDVDTPMRKVLSENSLVGSREEFAERVVKDTKEFKPHGKKVHEYEFREYHRRLQTFLLFYIEGAQFIDETDERWQVFTVYERLDLNGITSYSLVGYCTMYEFFHWPDSKRPRISQFLVLPPFQGQGHGSELYRYIYGMVKASPQYVDLTVEDPSESFDDMRDRNDMRYLLDHHAFDGLTAPVSPEDLHKLQIEYKISKRQMARCVEMGLLKMLDKPNAEAYGRYRLFVKRRIYAQNVDLLSGLEDDEKKQKVAESFASVVNDYHRVLSLI